MKYEFQVDRGHENDWNALALHPMQSWAWGEFRKSRQSISRLGVYEGDKLIRNFLVVWTKIAKWRIGYIPMGPIPTKEDIEELKNLGKKMQAIATRMGPMALVSEINKLPNELKRTHGLFKKQTYWWDLNKSESTLLENMHQKGRYNIKIAQKNGVKIEEDNSEEAVETHIRLLMNTARKQGVSFHSRDYHRKLASMIPMKIFLAKYGDETLASAMVFTHKDVAYYAFGGNSFEKTQMMASTLLVWEMARKLKTQGYKLFDLWGAETGAGFSQFKDKFGAEKVELVGAYDLVINKWLYPLFRAGEETRKKIRKLWK